MDKHAELYESKQNFNFITRFLHSTRYKNLKKLIISAAKQKEFLKVIDIGCGPGKAYEVIQNMGLNFNYLGIDPNENFCEVALNRYGQFPNFSIICDTIENQFDELNDADVIIGLETFEHIPEAIVVRTLEQISKTNFIYFYITVPNEIGPALLIKNLGSAIMGYSRYKQYTWKETFFASIYNLDKLPRHSTEHKGFDWRWLAQTVRQNVSIIKITKNPSQFIPRYLSPSIGFICKPDDKVKLLNF